MKKDNIGFYRQIKQSLEKLDTSLVGNIGKYIAIFLFVGFVVMISITSILSGKMLSNTMDSLLEENANNYANQTQSLVDNTECIADSMATYLEKYYASNNHNLDINALNYNSKVYADVAIDKTSAEAENYVVELIRNTVINDERVSSMGLLFEPYGFIQNINDYSIYTYKGVGKNDKPMPYEPYTTYGSLEWYGWVNKLEKTFSDPYDYGTGNYVISFMRAVKYNNQFKGLVAVDLNASYIDEAVKTSSSYSTMFNTLFNHNNKIAYTKNKKNINKTLDDMFKNKNERKKILAKMKKGKAFKENVTVFGGKKYCMYFTPIKAGNTTWWSATGLTVMQKNLSVYVMIAILVIICLVTLFSTIYVSMKSLYKGLKPIEGIVNIADEISQGNFDVEIDIESSNEIGKLSLAFKRMAQRVQDIIAEIDSTLAEMADGKYDRTSYEESKYVGEFKSILGSMKTVNENTNKILKNIVIGAKQVSNEAEAIEKGAESLTVGVLEQKDSIYRLNNTIDNVNELSENSAKTALDVHNKVTRAKNEAAIEIENINELTVAMKKINDTSKDIQKIIGVIEDIADQTNLLALNASIEAARAGETGKGFAIVAEQIGKLAGDSAESVLLTRDLIERSFREVIQGNNITMKAAASLKKIIDDMDEFSDGVKEVSEISQVQVAKIKEVKQDIEQIASVVVTNSQNAEESTANSEELLSQAIMLHELVNQFRLVE